MRFGERKRGGEGLKCAIEMQTGEMVLVFVLVVGLVLGQVGLMRRLLGCLWWLREGAVRGLREGYW